MSPDLVTLLQAHTCLYASFDRGPNPDFSRGASKARHQQSAVHHDPSAGLSGGALCFTAAEHGWTEDEYVLPAEQNFPYAPNGFSGTISFWLNGDPDRDLSPEVPVDPFHISRRAADGSFYLDLTRPNDERYGSPRKLRFGIYNDSPENNRFANGQLIVVGGLNWQRNAWHHVVATWENANSGKEDGRAVVYIDGVQRGWMEGYRHRVTWDIEDMTIGLGQRYTGRMDDLLVLDAALGAQGVEELYVSPGEIGQIAFAR